MFMNTIDASASEGLLTSVQKDLALLASTLDSRFLEAATTLATTVEAIDRVIASLDGVTSALDERSAGAAVNDLRAVAARLGTLPDAQAARSGQLAAVTDKTKVLREQVMVMHQSLQVLRIYGVNVKIAASGADEFVGFIDRMTSTLSGGENELTAFLVTLKDLDASVAAAQQAERILKAECSKVVPDVPNALANDAAELQAHLSVVAKSAQQVAAIARDVQGRVAVVLGALQVGDRARQRLEHVVAALQIVESRSGGGEAGEGMSSAAVAHVCRMLAAQLDACASDFDTEAQLLLASLVALGPDAARLLALLENEKGDDGRTFLHRLERGITEVEGLTTQLHEADVHSGGMLDTIVASLDALASRLGILRAMRLDVQSIAVNTRLMCRRFGDIGKAVSVIATEIDLSANQLGSALEHVTQPIQDLRQLSTAMREAQQSFESLDAGEALSRSLDVIRQGCRNTEHNVARGHDDANQVIALIEGVSDRLTQELTLTARMKTAEAALTTMASPETSPPDAEDPLLRDVLTSILRLYTMAQERDVHAAFLLPGMDPIISAPAASEDADDDDDGLF